MVTKNLGKVQNAMAQDKLVDCYGVGRHGQKGLWPVHDSHHACQSNRFTVKHFCDVRVHVKEHNNYILYSTLKYILYSPISRKCLTISFLTLSL